MYNHVSDGAVTTTVSALSDDRLLARTKELSGIEHHLEVVVIDHLREIQKRRLYLRRGFSSLFDYAVRELGYSDAAAWRRIKAMRLCADVEGVRERLQNGTMTLNAAAQLQHAFDRQERKKERAARSAPGGTGFGAAAQSQDGAAPPRPAERQPAPVPVLDSEGRRELVEQASGKSSREVMQLLAEVDPELAAAADRVRPLGGGRWELKAVIDDECRRGLERLKGLLSHVDPHLTLGQLMGRLVREGLDRHDPARPLRLRRAGARAAGAEQTSAAKPQASTRGATSAAKQAAGLNSAAPSAAKVSARAPAQPGDQAADRPDTSAAKPAGDATSAPKTRRPGRQAATAGGGAGCAAGADRNFDSEGGRPDRPRHPGGGQARCLAARPGPLQLRGPHQRAPLRLPTPAADRSRRAVCLRRRRRAEQSPPAVRRPSPLPPRRRRMRAPRRGSSGAGRPVITETWAWPPSGLTLTCILEMRPAAPAAAAVDSGRRRERWRSTSSATESGAGGGESHLVACHLHQRLTLRAPGAG